LCQLLGFPERPVQSGLAVGLHETEAELIAAIRRQWSDGYCRLKIKIKRGQDIALVRAVRREMGNIPLFVDANADYTRDDFKIFQALDDYDLTMFEQPLARGDLEGAAALQKQVRTPVCLDESMETAEDARRAAELGSCRIVNIKLQRVGGFGEALRIAQVCEASGILLWAGTMPELGVGTAATIVLASHPAFVFPTDAEPSRRWYQDDVLRPPIEMAQGCLSLPPGPGLGYEVDEDKLRRYEVQRWSFAAPPKSVP
jgi:o-succinylbenzoate synthase